jgi:hypothetical protein
MLVASTVPESWTTGFTGKIEVTNRSAVPISGWGVQFHLDASVQISALWNGALSRTDEVVVVTCVEWNAEIAAGAIVEIGYTASHPAGLSSHPRDVLLSCQQPVAAPAAAASKHVASTPVRCGASAGQVIEVQKMEEGKEDEGQRHHCSRAYSNEGISIGGYLENWNDLQNKAQLLPFDVSVARRRFHIMMQVL